MVVDSDQLGNSAQILREFRGDDRASPPQLREEGKAGEAPLVYNTKSIHAKRGVFDPETGEYQGFTFNERTREYVPDFDPEAARFERWNLQNVARNVLINDRNEKGRPWRVCTCMRKRVEKDVGIHLSEQYKKAHFSGLAACGSVWSCPICAAKISARRALEIEIAANVHHEAGGKLIMTTLTFRHSRADDLKKMIGSQKERIGFAFALQKFRNSRTYKRLVNELELLGLIRNIEVTYSDRNGWHPHAHELWFVSRLVTNTKVASVQAQLFDAWLDACKAANIGLPTRKTGLDMRLAQSPAEYLQKWGREQKWGAPSELTKSHTKKARSSKGFTPFDLLRAYGEGHDPRFAGLFRVYVSAFQGTRQCFWSPGLKSVFDIAEKSDERIAAERDDAAIEVTRIHPDQWRLLLAQPFEARLHVLRLAETLGRQAINEFLTRIARADFIDNYQEHKIDRSKPKIDLVSVPRVLKPLSDFSQVDSRIRESLLGWAAMRPVPKSVKEEPPLNPKSKPVKLYARDVYSFDPDAEEVESP